MTTGVAAPRLSTRQRLALTVLLGTGFLLPIDFSILNVALPEIGVGVGLSLAALPWVATAYALPAAGLTLLCGRLADLCGRRRLFSLGLLLLGLSGLLGGLADGPALLLTARALQGLASAIAAPAALAMVVTALPDPRQRARVLGINGALSCAGFTVGALLGGALVGLLSWRWAFLINVPVAAVILLATPLVVPATAVVARTRLDVLGAATVTVGLTAAAFGVLNRSWWALAAGAVLLAVFVAVERRARDPLLRLDLVARPTIRFGNLGGLAVLAMESGLVFLLTLYLQKVLHLGPLATGLVLGLPGLAAVAAGVVASALITRLGHRTVLVGCLALQVPCTGVLVLAGASRASLGLVLPALVVGFFVHITATVAFMVTATTEVPAAEQGMATSLAALTQQVAGIVGIPVLGAVATSPASLLTGVRLGIALIAVVLAATAVLVGRGLRPARSTPDRPADPTALETTAANRTAVVRSALIGR